MPWSGCIAIATTNQLPINASNTHFKVWERVCTHDSQLGKNAPEPHNMFSWHCTFLNGAGIIFPRVWATQPGSMCILLQGWVCSPVWGILTACVCSPVVFVVAEGSINVVELVHIHRRLIVDVVLQHGKSVEGSASYTLCRRAIFVTWCAVCKQGGGAEKTRCGWGRGQLSSQRIWILSVGGCRAKTNIDGEFAVPVRNLCVGLERCRELLELARQLEHSAHSWVSGSRCLTNSTAAQWKGTFTCGATPVRASCSHRWWAQEGREAKAHTPCLCCPI